LLLGLLLSRLVSTKLQQSNLATQRARTPNPAPAPSTHPHPPTRTRTPAPARPQVMRGTAGRVLEEVLSDVFLNGAKPVSEFESDRVAATVKDLRLDPGVAKTVFAEVAKARLKGYASQAIKDLQRDKKAAAQALKKLVQFNSLAVTPLMERVTGEEVPRAASSSGGEDEGGAALRASRGEYGEEERRAQKEVNLGDEIEEAVR